MFVINGHPGNLLSSGLLPDCKFEMQTHGERTIIEYVDGETVRVPTKLIRRLDRQGLLESVPAPTLRGYPTASEAIEAVRRESGEIREWTVWVCEDDPVTCWFSKFTVDQHDDGSWEPQVILEEDSKGHPQRAIWLSDFRENYRLHSVVH